MVQIMRTIKFALRSIMNVGAVVGSLHVTKIMVTHMQATHDAGFLPYILALSVGGIVMYSILLSDIVDYLGGK